MGWNTIGQGWHVRRERPAGQLQTGGRWTAPDFGVVIIAVLIRWELAVAFLALKLWHQASGHPGNTLAFAREKWDGLVVATQRLMSGATTWRSGWPSQFGARSSGSEAFDAWRRGELERIEAERFKLRAAERDFAAYRDSLLQATDGEDFDRFMASRTGRK